MVRTSSVCGATFVLVGLALNVPANAVSSGIAMSQSALTQSVSVIADSGIAERKGSPKWCSKHPRKCAKSGGMPM